MIIIDFETTGLPRGGNDWNVQPGIIQIGAIKLEKKWNGGDLRYFEVDEFQSMVNPEKTDWDAGAIKTHGIQPESVLTEPTFFEMFPKFASFVHGSDTWIGYNTKFDRDILHWQLKRYGFERNFPWPIKELDVMRQARVRLEQSARQGNKQWKLIDAYKEVFGKDFDGAHDALGDCRATAALFMEWNNV